MRKPRPATLTSVLFHCRGTTDARCTHTRHASAITPPSECPEPENVQSLTVA